MQYVSPSWLTNGHLQTIVPAKLLKVPAVLFRRERWDTPDSDFIDLDFIDGAPDQPLVVLFHGLEGSSESHYARALMLAVRQRGWAGVVVHFRGCSGEPNRAPRFYHSGDSAEINWVLRRVRSLHAQRRLFVCGVSLGGNALLRWLGENGQSAQFVDAACSVSAPLDLAAGGAALSSGFNMVYTRMFLKTLKSKCLHKLTQYPDLFDRQRMLASRDLYDFDNVVTAPLHGYRNTEDYWHRASAKFVLNDITVPTLVLNAKNDPFLPGQFLPNEASRQVTLEYPLNGGHVGFANAGWPANNMWLPKRVLHYFDQHVVNGGVGSASTPAQNG
jgi:predicted alpha/beta-fold hydrolase